MARVRKMFHTGFTTSFTQFDITTTYLIKFFFQKVASFLLFTLPVLIGPGAVQQTNKQRKGVSRHINYLIQIIKTVTKSISPLRIRSP